LLALLTDQSINYWWLLFLFQNGLANHEVVLLSHIQTNSPETGSWNPNFLSFLTGDLQFLGGINLCPWTIITIEVILNKICVWVSNTVLCNFNSLNWIIILVVVQSFQIERRQWHGVHLTSIVYTCRILFLFDRISNWVQWVALII